MLDSNSVLHLTGVSKFLDQHQAYFELFESGSKEAVLSRFKNDSTLRYIFVNPNAQGYFIDEEFLNKT